MGAIANARLDLAQTKLPTLDFNGTYRFSSRALSFHWGMKSFWQFR